MEQTYQEKRKANRKRQRADPRKDKWRKQRRAIRKRCVRRKKHSGDMTVGARAGTRIRRTRTGRKRRFGTNIKETANTG